MKRSHLACQSRRVLELVAIFLVLTFPTALLATGDSHPVEGASHPGGGAAEAAHKVVEELIGEQVAAWNRGDLEAFCELYAQNAVFVSPSGLTRGREEVLARYQRRYPDRAAMGTLGLELLEVEVAEVEGIAVGVSIVGRWSLEYPQKEGAREPASGLTLLYLRPRPCELCGPGFPDPEGGWEIVHDASM